ncbi:recombination-associated protein RdgC (plasmid) [Escherichia coli]
MLNCYFIRQKSLLVTADSAVVIINVAILPVNPHQHRFCILVEAKRETKILPPPVIQRAIQEKIEKLEQEQARKLKKTEKDSLKDEVLHSLLPRAFSKFSVIQAIYDGSTKRIYINASARQAEDMLALMRKSLGSLPVVPLSVENPIELTLTDWVRDGSAPEVVY